MKRREAVRVVGGHVKRGVRVRRVHVHRVRKNATDAAAASCDQAERAGSVAFAREVEQRCLATDAWNRLLALLALLAVLEEVEEVRSEWRREEPLAKPSLTGASASLETLSVSLLLLSLVALAMLPQN